MDICRIWKIIKNRNKNITGKLFGRKLQTFKGGFIFDEGGTKVIEVGTYKKYDVSTIFRIAFYFHLFKPHWFAFRFVINNKKPYLNFKFLRGKLGEIKLWLN